MPVPLLKQSAQSPEQLDKERKKRDANREEKRGDREGDREGEINLRFLREPLDVTAASPADSVEPEGISMS